MYRQTTCIDSVQCVNSCRQTRHTNYMCKLKHSVHSIHTSRQGAQTQKLLMGYQTFSNLSFTGLGFVAVTLSHSLLQLSLPLPPLTILAEVQFHKACEVGNARGDAVEVILTDCQFAEVCQTKQFLERGKENMKCQWRLRTSCWAFFTWNTFLSHTSLP